MTVLPKGYQDIMFRSTHPGSDWQFDGKMTRGGIEVALLSERKALSGGGVLIVALVARMCTYHHHPWNTLMLWCSEPGCCGNPVF